MNKWEFFYLEPKEAESLKTIWEMFEGYMQALTRSTFTGVKCILTSLANE